MWGLQGSRFLGGIPPRLLQSAVRLGNRWLPQRGYDGRQTYERKGALNNSRSLSASPDAERARRASRRARRSVPAAAAATAAAAGSSTCDPSAGHPGSDQYISIDLDYVPSLGLAREVLCVLLPLLGVLALFSATGRWHGGALQAQLAALLGAAAGISLTRAAWMEGEYKARERAHAELGDGDSHFRPIAIQPSPARGRAAEQAGGRPDQHAHRSLVVHVKVKVGDLSQVTTGPSAAGHRRVGEAEDGGSGGGGGGGTISGVTTSCRGGSCGLFAVHCYHGFGANLGSYKRVQAALAAALRGVVTAHDMPGFGLTQRPSEMSSYFLNFNGRLGRLVMDYELQRLGLLAGKPAPGGKVGAGGEPSVLPAGAGVAAARATPAGRWGRGGAASDGSGVEVVTVSVDGDGSVLEHDAISSQPREREEVHQGRQQGRKAPDATPAIQRILVGHSLGGACAALEAVSHPSGLAGLVLVAPAIFAAPGPEFDQVKLSPERRDPASPASTSVSASAGASQATAPSSTAGTERAAAVLFGPELLGSRIADPPELRRLYPMGSFPPPPGANHGAEEGRPGPHAHVPGTPGRRLLRALTTLLTAVASLAMLCVLRLLSPIITQLLRGLVRSRNFWTKGLQQAYYNPAMVTPDIVDLYRMPQLVRGWEAGMVSFLLARLVQPRISLPMTLRALFGPKRVGAPAGAANSTTTNVNASACSAAVAVASDAEAAALRKIPPPAAAEDDDDDVAADGHANADLASRMFQLVSERRLPVLIVHGLYDKLVPASNSQRLARMLPGCELALLDRCGHMPQEEMPELFVSLVADFASRVADREVEGGDARGEGGARSSP